MYHQVIYGRHFSTEAPHSAAVWQSRRAYLGLRPSFIPSKPWSISSGYPLKVDGGCSDYSVAWAAPASLFFSSIFSRLVHAIHSQRMLITSDQLQTNSKYIIQFFCCMAQVLGKKSTVWSMLFVKSHPLIIIIDWVYRPIMLIDLFYWPIVVINWSIVVINRFYRPMMPINWF